MKTTRCGPPRKGSSAAPCKSNGAERSGKGHRRGGEGDCTGPGAVDSTISAQKLLYRSWHTSPSTKPITASRSPRPHAPHHCVRYRTDISRSLTVPTELGVCTCMYVRRRPGDPQLAMVQSNISPRHLRKESITTGRTKG